MRSKEAHVSDELLLMELDGELSPGVAKAVRAHLDSCWSCRARRQELDGSLTDFRHAYHQAFDGQLPSPESSRSMLQARLAQLGAPGETAPQRWFARRENWIPVLAASLLGLAAAVWITVASGSAWMRHTQSGRDVAFSTPDLRLTPGATVLLSQSAVCSQANIKNKEVPATVQRLVFEEYGLAKAPSRAYEVDYLVTPALGGSDDIHNLWPHSYSSVWNARVKDELEDRLREMVCDGSLDLAQAQHEIASNWIEAYKKYFHTDWPLPKRRRN